MGQPAQDYWLMVYDYMSEGNGPVPLELKVRTQPMPPLPTINHTPRAQTPSPEFQGAPNEPLAKPTQLWMDKTSERSNATPRPCLA